MTRRIFLAAAGVYALAVVGAALLWPDRVPLHFDGGLRADSYGGKWPGIAMAAGLGVFLVALFAGLARMVRRIGLELINVRHPEFWKAPANEQRLRRRLAEDVYHVGAATLILLAGVFTLITQAARAGRDTLSGWAFALLAAYVVYLVTWVGWLLTGRYRPDR